LSWIKLALDLQTTAQGFGGGAGEAGTVATLYNEAETNGEQ
jgi:hypothetical protein